MAQAGSKVTTVMFEVSNHHSLIWGHSHDMAWKHVCFCKLDVNCAFFSICGAFRHCTFANGFFKTSNTCHHYSGIHSCLCCKIPQVQKVLRWPPNKYHDIHTSYMCINKKSLDSLDLAWQHTSSTLHPSM